MSDECGDMQEPTVKVEPPDNSMLDSASTVKTEPADVDDVYSLKETIVKEEMEIEPTVIRPPDFVYMQRPCRRAMSDECGDMQEPTVKVEPPDNSMLDSASTVKTEPADVDDVYSLEETIVKEEMEIEPTVIRPPDFVYMQRPCKQEPVENTPAETSYSVEPRDDCTRDKSYSTINDLAKTASVDGNNSPPLRCNTCNKYFKFNSQLKIHVRTHTDDRPYDCKVCNKRFKIKYHLKEHSRTHTSGRPYNCEVCNKRFKCSFDFKKHSRIHTGERPYNCDICNKRFIKSGTLKEHSKIHTGEKPYNCEVCNKRFTRSGSLNKHKKIHG